MTKVFLTLALMAAASPLYSGPIVFNTWYEFQFGAPTGPGGACTSCTPSSGTPTVYADAPAWTFTTSSGSATFTVTDAFVRVDQFDVLDFGISIGTTSVPSGSGTCGDDPVPCLADPLTSSRVYSLAPGAHSITISHIAGTSGAAYFMAASGIPEPATVLLFSSGILALGCMRRKKRTA